MVFEILIVLVIVALVAYRFRGRFGF